MKAWDAIVIGGGHNGLVNACYLQRAGLDVLVVEKNDWVGGAATSRELTPGFLYSNCSYVCSLFRPEIMRDLELPRFGLQVISYEGGAVFTRDGDYLANYRDHDAHRREFARSSKRDAEAYDRYSRDVTRRCRFIQPLLMRTAPDPTSFKPRDLGELLYLGKKFAGLSTSERALTLRFWTMSISDFLDEYFETDVIKANFALSGIIGTALGPMSPGTAYVLLHHYMGEVDGSVGAWGYARGAWAPSPGRWPSQGQWRHHPHRCRSRPGADQERQGQGRGACRRRGDLRQARHLQCRRQAHFPEAGRGEGAARHLPAPRPQFQNPRLLRESQHRARFPARIPGFA
ncbi:NAD(P)/FAD-dependent oxidoreductase [Mesorhizobium sp. CA8]|nr:NAD(P)/FAD-dependent oxidoreductase [Mesorhizobium sp. CA8]